MSQPGSIGENRNYSRYFKPRGNRLYSGRRKERRGREIGHKVVPEVKGANGVRRHPWACAGALLDLPLACHLSNGWSWGLQKDSSNVSLFISPFNGCIVSTKEIHTKALVGDRAMSLANYFQKIQMKNILCIFWIATFLQVWDFFFFNLKTEHRSTVDHLNNKHILSFPHGKQQP